MAQRRRFPGLKKQSNFPSLSSGPPSQDAFSANQLQERSPESQVLPQVPKSMLPFPFQLLPATSGFRITGGGGKRMTMWEKKLRASGSGLMGTTATNTLCRAPPHPPVITFQQHFVPGGPGLQGPPRGHQHGPPSEEDWPVRTLNESFRSKIQYPPHGILFPYRFAGKPIMASPNS